MRRLQVSSLCHLILQSLLSLLHIYVSPSTPGQMSGCPERWTVWSSCLMNMWLKSAEVWPHVQMTYPSVRSSCMTSWHSITDKHNRHRCWATTSSTFTPASQSYWVRRWAAAGLIWGFCFHEDFIYSSIGSQKEVYIFLLCCQWTGSEIKLWRLCSWAWSCRTLAAGRSCVDSSHSCPLQPRLRRWNCTKRWELLSLFILCGSTVISQVSVNAECVTLRQVENRMAVKRSFSSAIIYSKRLPKGKVDLMVLFMMDSHCDLFKVRPYTSFYCKTDHDI